MLHELRCRPSARLPPDQLPALQMLARVSKIMEQLVRTAWMCWATMTPPEYSAIRSHLGARPVFQSQAPLHPEFMLGNKRRCDAQARMPTGPNAWPRWRWRRSPSSSTRPPGLMARRGGPWRVCQRVISNVTGPSPTRPARCRRQAWLTVARRAPQHWDLPSWARNSPTWRRLPSLALPPDDRGPHHQRQDRHRWHQRRCRTCAACSTWCCSRRSGSCARTRSPHRAGLRQRNSIQKSGPLHGILVQAPVGFLPECCAANILWEDSWNLEKVAVITGGASGIGRAAAVALAAADRRVALVDMNDAVVGSGPNKSTVPMPAARVRRPLQGRHHRRGSAPVFDTISSQYGPVTLCVPAAGITRDDLAGPRGQNHRQGPHLPGREVPPAGGRCEPDRPGTWALEDDRPASPRTAPRA